MSADVKRFCDQCIECIKHAVMILRKPQLEVSVKPIKVFENIGMDELNKASELGFSKTKKSKKDGENEWETMSIDY
jgi:hypothetical protein